MTSHTPPAVSEERTLIDALLAEQRDLSAVERFADWHESRDHHARNGHYKNLIPLSAPGQGEQFAFEVDLDKCSGCKACVTACHSLNGLDDNETWRGVGLLIGDPADDFRARRGAAAFQQHVTSACHHCVDPACSNGCPVLAYDKDPQTGIVRHLDDQCIGCQYCVMMCPYEVPQYSKKRGIVRKCDMCSSRLAVGEAPACVQACPTSAIRITIVEQDKVRGRYRGLPQFNAPLTRNVSRLNPFLPASPNPAITLPSTRFVTQRVLPENLFAGDHLAVHRADSHLPLVMLLVFSQLSVGVSLAAAFLKPTLPLLLGALAAGVAAVSAGSLHLGQPLKAWRSFLGWRKSWFSREVIGLNVFLFALTLAIAAVWLQAPQFVEKILLPAAAVAGLATVACSAMIYVETRREFWRPIFSFGKFFSTTLLLGAAATLVALALAGAAGGTFSLVAGMLVAISLIKLGLEHRVLAALVDETAPLQTPLNKTARLLTGELGHVTRWRIACGVLGGVLMPFIALLQMATQNSTAIPALVIASFVLCVAGELFERFLFFTAVATQKMPGGLAS